MRNVHTLKDISSSHRLGSAHEMELEKMLRNSIQSISELTNEYNEMQGNNEIADLSNPPPPPMDNSLQKLPGWLSDDLRPLVYECGLEDKVRELDKSFARKNILEALQELLFQDEMVSRSQTDTLPNQSVYSQPAHSEKSISKEGVAKQSGGAEAVPLS
ncbi:hypothetical protein C1645_831761 [Glomus cerebriforme]|uniref:Uncharacterized protein n=1 Tax=Glomus cerebriforme TaxID=658196 RepID=A0A397SKZ1_9GLOM|nr:hypothetical protein C1645_831761 [Glomus cerebriforme]